MLVLLREKSAVLKEFIFLYPLMCENDHNFTASRIKIMNNTSSNLTVYKGNQIIEAGYKLSLNEQRVVLACIAQVHSKEALLTTDEFEFIHERFFYVIFSF